VISKEKEADILRLFHAEKWKVNTIASSRFRRYAKSPPFQGHRTRPSRNTLAVETCRWTLSRGRVAARDLSLGPAGMLSHGGRVQILGDGQEGARDGRRREGIELFPLLHGKRDEHASVVGAHVISHVEGGDFDARIVEVVGRGDGGLDDGESVEGDDGRAKGKQCSTRACFPTSPRSP
jgi:hypothetical protein